MHMEWSCFIDVSKTAQNSSLYDKHPRHGNCISRKSSADKKRKPDTRAPGIHVDIYLSI